MAGYNRVVMVGNLTRDPELKYIPSGTALCKFGIATSKKFKRGDGTFSEDVCFITVVAWGKRGEVVAEHLKKGSQVLVEGQLKFSTWQDDKGGKHSKHEINADNIVFLGRPKARTDESPPTTREQEEEQERGIEDHGSDQIEEDEVPF